jgi:enoyl-CoA hydratase/carnithine racemase
MSFIRVERDGPVRTVILDRADKRNALNAEMMQGIRQLFLDEPPTEERVTVIRGEGSSFCAGLELAVGGVDPEDANLIVAMFDAVQRYPLPVIARVQGAAIAGGCELALHCDFTVAADNARFAMPLAQIGVATTWFLTKKIMETAGPVLGREMLLLGNPVDAVRLHDLGVIARAVAESDLDTEITTMTDRLAANAPLSMRAMKAIMVKQMGIYDLPPHAEEDAIIEAIWDSFDAREGVTARVEKRRPNFKGK